MDTPQDLIGHISGGRVLDVATGTGNFIHFLIEGLRDYAEIIGIDTSERAAAPFTEAFQDNPRVHFQAVDALHMPFAAASFDTVCVANSLHHFEQPEDVMDEMLRVLRPGGTFILAEMFRDGQTETQMTHVHLHHWWAEVDRACGVVHNKTYPRAQLEAMLYGLGLQDLTLHLLSDTSEDPKTPEHISGLGAIIDRYIQRAEGHPDLQARGEELRQRVNEIGFHGAAALLAIGVKRA